MSIEKAWLAIIAAIVVVPYCALLKEKWGLADDPTSLSDVEEQEDKGGGNG
jgi:hypothetical protein